MGIGFICNCSLDTPEYNHAYGFGYLTRRSIYGDVIRLYDAPSGGDVIFTASCEDIFEVFFPTLDSGGPLSMAELKNKVEEKERATLSASFFKTKGGEGK